MYRHSSSDETQPLRVRNTQPVTPLEPLPQTFSPRKHRTWKRGVVTLGFLLGILAAMYVFMPGRTNVLLLGIDRSPPDTNLGRSDTMVLVTVVPPQPYVGMLSIPRDLWISTPDWGELRINSPHFFAEAELAGSGPAAAVSTVQAVFGVDVDAYVRFNFEGFTSIVDALGGIPIELETSMGGLPPGKHVLDGESALAFVRDRYGSDDFFRMGNGQIFARAFFARILHPSSWPRLPGALLSFMQHLDTDLAPWMWPRLFVAFLRSGPAGIDARIISREMVQGFTTAQGAQVLAPDWSMINPVLLEMFGQ